MSLQDYLRAIRKYWWMIAVSTVGGLLLSALLLSNATPIYRGSVQFFATTTASATTSNPLLGDQFGQQRVSTYVKLLSSQRLAERVQKATGVTLDVDTVMRSIDGKADLNTVLFTAYVRDSSPTRTATMTQAVAEEFPALVDEIETQAGTKEAPVKLTVTSGPALTTSPVSPVKRLWLGTGLLLGLLVGIGLALLRALLDRSVRTVELLREVTNTPVLGRIPSESVGRKEQIVVEGTSGRPAAEAFRQLRTNLQFVDIEEPVEVLVVTSSLPGEGKSTTSANLAIAFAEAGKRVLLIDADLRRPRLASILGLEGSVGLTNVLAGQISLRDGVQQWGRYHLHLLAAGPIPPNPSELLGSHQMADVIHNARAIYDLVIVDTAPLLPVTDGAITAAGADGAIVVVRYGKTKSQDVERAADALHNVDARLLGTVLNRAPNKGVDAYGYDEYAVKTENFHPRPRTKAVKKNSKR